MALLLPHGNTAEAAVVEGLRLLPVRTLAEAVDVLNLSRDQWPASPARARSSDAGGTCASTWRICAGRRSRAALLKWRRPAATTS